MTAFNLIPHSFGLLGRFGSERVMSVNVLHRVLKKKKEKFQLQKAKQIR